MVSWDFDPDAIEVPEPYTPEEWAETEGARDFRERALDAGYDPSDPKAISLEMWGEL